MIVGALLSGNLIKRGRKYSLDLAAVVGITGSAMSLIELKEAILIGKFIYGLSVGIISVALPRYIEEVMPISIVS